MHCSKTTYQCDSTELLKGWTELLNHPAWRWRWFVTLTYRQSVKSSSAELDFMRWLSRLHKDRFGARYRSRGQTLNWARALEYQKRGVLHYHVLMGKTGNLDRFDAMRLWETCGPEEWIRDGGGQWRSLPRTGFARIYPYDPAQGAVGYVAKYVSKSGEITVGCDGVTCTLLREPLLANARQAQGVLTLVNHS